MQGLAHVRLCVGDYEPGWDVHPQLANAERKA